ncbi:hypothetical protein [Bdellovibrio sp. NC01]|uniref:hypothetical protein n=1 Tax=Bdellovibrio sp. NC01 TaxID=2220073 RepID=UPI00115C1FF7|nr:hypothetical protein [Bdellovibrio sp. NC01]QDK37065.1 hypothetical protein DOE51_05385 [Bdellovibrio sp. NC01]
MKHSRFAFITGLLTTTVLTLSACKNEGERTAPPTDKAKAAAATKTAITDADARPVSNARNSGSLADQCFNDLCKDTTIPELVSLLESKQTPGPGMKDYFDKNLRPLLNQKVAVTQEMAKILLSRIEVEEPGFAAIRLNPAQEKAVKAIMLLTGSDSLPHEVGLQGITALSQTDVYKASGKFGIKKGATYVQTLYPNVSVVEATYEVANKALETQKILNEQLGSPLLTMSEEIATKALKKEALDNEEIEALSSSAYGIALFDFFIRGKGAAVLEQAKLQTSDLLKLYNGSKVKNTFKQRMAAQDSLIDKCEKRYYQTLNLYPQEQTLTAFKEKAELVRQRAMSLLPDSDPAKAKLKDSTFTWPKTPTEMTRAWGNTLKLGVKSETEEVKKAAAYDASTIFTMAVLYSAIPQDSNFLCGEMIDLNVSDATLASDTSIKVSWLSVRYPQIGMAILAHELGHVVDNFSNSMSNQQLCVRDKQTSGKYGAEDFADLFSNQVMVALAKTDHVTTQNFGCFFAASNETLSLKNESSTDPHSSDLFRAIQIHLGLGKDIPQSCSSLAAQENPKALNTCH